MTARFSVKNGAVGEAEFTLTELAAGQTGNISKQYDDGTAPSVGIDVRDDTGLSLTLDGSVGLNVYLDAEPQSVSTDRFDWATGRSDQGSYAAVTGIPASKLNEVFTLRVDGSSYTGSALSYANLALKKSKDPQLHTLCRALIRYNETAIRFFEEGN